ncbi:MAG: hypothetical protein PWP15_781 [Methanothermococcus sp.]|jgi:hypothetical protein|nr:hypothetical protein [Methanothermococcus sp.]MDK2987721.1 hypothetical protein [Methanothermococcus sp.]
MDIAGQKANETIQALNNISEDVSNNISNITVE